jgi:hypothetical protein
MSSDAEVLADVTRVFGRVPRPAKFTNHPGCSECEEHDETLQAHTLETLSIEEVGSQAWNPIVMCTPDAFRYLMPALARICLGPSDHPLWGWYGEPFFQSDLRRNGPRNDRWVACTPEERACIARFIEHVIDTRGDLIQSYDMQHELLDAFSIWSDKGDQT